MTTRAIIRAEIQSMVGNPANLADSDYNTLIDTAHLEIANEHPWPHMRRDEIVSTVADRSGTDGGYTLGSATVTSASAATGDDPEYFLRRSGDYDYWRVTGVADGVSWTIEQPWPRVTATAQAWTLFQRFYKPPTDASHTLLEILDVVEGNSFLEERALDWLNRADPARMETGTPACWVPSPAGEISEEPHFELWPRPATATPLRVWWREVPVLASDSSAVEYPYRLAVLRGAMRACQRMFGFTEYDKWMTLRQSFAQEYADVLAKAKRSAGRIHGRTRRVREVRSIGRGGRGYTDFGVNRGFIV